MTTSTGPTTSAGKAIAAQNSLKHGLRARAIVLPDESQDDWEAFEGAYLEDLAPVGIAEQTLALRAAELLWRMRRVATAERDAVLDQMERPDYYTTPRLKLPSFANYRPPSEPPDMLPESLPAPAALRPLMRYEAHLSRQFFQVTRELQAMQDRRQGRSANVTRVEIHGYPGKSEPHAHGQEPHLAPSPPAGRVGEGYPVPTPIPDLDAMSSQPLDGPSSADPASTTKLPNELPDTEPKNDHLEAPSPLPPADLDRAPSPPAGRAVMDLTLVTGVGYPAHAPGADPEAPSTTNTTKLPNELHDLTRRALPYMSPGSADLLRLLLDRDGAEDDDDDEQQDIPEYMTPEAEAEDERLEDEMRGYRGPRFRG